MTENEYCTRCGKPAHDGVDIGMTPQKISVERGGKKRYWSLHADGYYDKSGVLDENTSILFISLEPVGMKLPERSLTQMFLDLLRAFFSRKR
jgi:hypothetical protein